MAALALAGILSAVPSASDVASPVRTLLASDLTFSPAELTELERGKIVKHGLAATAPGEIAAVGAVRVTGLKERFIAEYRDIVQFKRGADVLEIGRFANSPTMDDLTALTIDRQDVDLRRCRVGDCDVRLPADAIARVQHDMDWSAHDADARAGALFKAILFGHVRSYMTGGPGRITEYDDDKRPIRPVADFIGVLSMSPYLGVLVPGLDEHLRDFPERPLAGAEDFLYWSKEKFGLAPFITVTHVTITRDAAQDYVLTSKDVYSSRYVDASLTFTLATDAVTTPGAFYLIYVNRSRVNALKGPLAGLRRAIVERRVKSSLEENLKNLKSRFEHRP